MFSCFSVDFCLSTSVYLLYGVHYFYFILFFTAQCSVSAVRCQIIEIDKQNIPKIPLKNNNIVVISLLRP